MTTDSRTKRLALQVLSSKIVQSSSQEKCRTMRGEKNRADESGHRVTRDQRWGSSSASKTYLDDSRSLEHPSRHSDKIFGKRLDTVRSSDCEEEYDGRLPSVEKNDSYDDCSDGEGRHIDRYEDVMRAYEGEDITDLTVLNETDKRRNRRQAQKEREREVKKRRKLGLTHNVLSVNEYTGRPYGYGVTAWQRELRVLSRKLNPAILNINQQPYGAVEEISEWIQHTWHYTAPVCYEIVKEIVAKAVRVRRSDIYSKIKNNEGKPEDLSDKSWRTLIEFSNSPAHMQKSEDCRVANACRVNFGRTGPSGEVGVTARLKKKLGRLPNPEEITYEMQRDKGYGGKPVKNWNKHEIMHGNEDRPQGKRHSDCRISSMALILHSACADDDGVQRQHVNKGKGKTQVEDSDGSSDEAVDEQCPVTDEQFFGDPRVQDMMQRLKDYEAERGGGAVTTRQSILKRNSKKGRKSTEAAGLKRLRRCIIDDDSEEDDNEEDPACSSSSQRRKKFYD